MMSSAPPAQLQQRPAAQEGERIKRAGGASTTSAGSTTGVSATSDRSHQIVLSWDTSLKDRKRNDYVSGQAWGVHRADRYLLRTFHRAREPASARSTRCARCTPGRTGNGRAPRSRILIETAASGPDAIEQLKRELTGCRAGDRERIEGAARRGRSTRDRVAQLLPAGKLMPDIDVGYVRRAGCRN